MTETEARKAFNTADAELQNALSKYQQARAALHRVTGEFHGSDAKLVTQFNQAMRAPAGGADRLVADC